MKILGLMLSLLFSQILVAGPSQEFLHNDAALKKKGSYTLSTPRGNDRPKNPGLLIFFHGSGSTRTYAAGFEGLDKVAKSLGLLALAIQAPNGASTWANRAQGPSNQHDDYVKNLLDKVLGTLPDVDRDRLLFVGLSAGSTFLSGDFLPRYITRYKGGAVLLCGGGGPVSLDKSLYSPLKKSEASALPISLYIQQADFLYRQTMQGIAYWKARKAKVTAETPAGGGHCAFDVNQEIGRLGKTILPRR